MRWSEAVTVEFVKFYVKHECLWNPDDPNYKIKYRRDKAYADIINDFKDSTNTTLSVYEVKQKIKNLRTTYCQQVHKILQKSDPDHIYVPSLAWFNEMDRCLKNISNQRNSGNYYIVNESKVNESSRAWVDEEITKQEENVHPDPLLEEFDEEYEIPAEPSSESEIRVKKERRNSSPAPYKSKKKRLKHKNSTRERYEDSSPETVVREDEFDIYGKYIASQLRKMDLAKAIKLQLEIQSLVSEARLSDIRES